MPEPVVAGSNALKRAPSRWLTGNKLGSERLQGRRKPGCRAVRLARLGPRPGLEHGIDSDRYVAQGQDRLPGVPLGSRRGPRSRGAVVAQPLPHQAHLNLCDSEAVRLPAAVVDVHRSAVALASIAGAVAVVPRPRLKRGPQTGHMRVSGA